MAAGRADLFNGIEASRRASGRQYRSSSASVLIVSSTSESVIGYSPLPIIFGEIPPELASSRASSSMEGINAERIKSAAFSMAGGTW
eukprot:CCRYP_007138-RA/>CCRYP_007138-RA protein AED:0.08 eAED:0.08 QI:907/0/1/1/0/0/2/751/86